MTFKDKAQWRVILDRWASCQHLHLIPMMDHWTVAALTTHAAVIEAWVSGAEIEVATSNWPFGWITTTAPVFRPERVYRIKPTKESNMEQYSKEFWQQCINIGTMHLSPAIAGALNYSRVEITAWINGVALEYFDDGKWIPVPKEHHRFALKVYRKVPPKPEQCDVVVFYRDKVEMGRGGRPGTRFTLPAGIGVTRLPVEPTSEHAPTLSSLQAKTPGFKLLSITRVVIDDNHDLIEHSSKLANIGNWAEINGQAK